MLSQWLETMLVMLLIRLKESFCRTLQNTSFYSDILGKKISLRVTSKGIKTVEKNGGIDTYILSLKNSKLNVETKKLKKSSFK